MLTVKRRETWREREGSGKEERWKNPAQDDVASGERQTKKKGNSCGRKRLFDNK